MIGLLLGFSAHQNDLARVVTALLTNKGGMQNSLSASLTASLASLASVSKLSRFATSKSPNWRLLQRAHNTYGAGLVGLEGLGGLGGLARLVRIEGLQK
jgi:hypothetical protein